MASILGRVTLAVMKHYYQSNLGKGSFLVYISMSLLVTEGSQERHSNRARTWRQEILQRVHKGVLFTDLLPLT